MLNIQNLIDEVKGFATVRPMAGPTGGVRRSLWRDST